MRTSIVENVGLKVVIHVKNSTFATFVVRSKKSFLQSSAQAHLVGPLKTWPGRRPGIFFTVSEWGRRDPAEDPVANSMSSALQKHIIVIKCKGCVLLE